VVCPSTGWRAASALRRGLEARRRLASCKSGDCIRAALSAVAWTMPVGGGSRPGPPLLQLLRRGPGHSRDGRVAQRGQVLSPVSPPLGRSLKDRGWSCVNCHSILLRDRARAPIQGASRSPGGQRATWMNKFQPHSCKDAPVASRCRIRWERKRGPYPRKTQAGQTPRGSDQGSGPRAVSGGLPRPGPGAPVPRTLSAHAHGARGPTATLQGKARRRLGGPATEACRHPPEAAARSSTGMTPGAWGMMRSTEFVYQACRITIVCSTTEQLELR